MIGRWTRRMGSYRLETAGEQWESFLLYAWPMPGRGGIERWTASISGPGGIYIPAPAPGFATRREAQAWAEEETRVIIAQAAEEYGVYLYVETAGEAGESRSTVLCTLCSARSVPAGMARLCSASSPCDRCGRNSESMRRLDLSNDSSLTRVSMLRRLAAHGPVDNTAVAGMLQAVRDRARR